MLEAFFLPVDPGERFCLLNTPNGAVRRSVVYVHPFAEELNKARRMAALQARRLADEGCAVLRIDFLGCGDSSGDFSEGRWPAWKRDVGAAIAYLAERFNAPLTLWGLRLGAVLAAEIAQDGVADHLVLWQPVVSGRQFLTQFLRMRLASEMLAEGAARSATSELAKTLANGETLEIAGYELHPALALALERIELDLLVPAVKRVDWMEIVADASAPVRVAARRVVEAWQGRDIRVHSVVGEPFWSTVEISECQRLIGITASSMNALS